MKIHHIQIARFRGIRELDWDLKGDTVCLIGPGDSTKSTILDAIGFCLSPYWNVSFNDTDFYDSNTSDPLVVIVTIGGAPKELLKESKFGLAVRGWNPRDGIHDEPHEGDELVLSIRLTVDSSLEPQWRVVNDRNPEGVVISPKDREKLGMVRLGQYFDRDLTWNRGSILGRVTGQIDELQKALADASRAAMASLKPDDVPTLQKAAKKVEGLGTEFGVGRRSPYEARLDIQGIRVGTTGITLHEGNVPLRLSGLGTRRLLSLSLQWDSASHGGISLIDEVEYGLEPHRIRRLVSLLKNDVSDIEPAPPADTDCGQIFITTHSPTVLVQLDAEDLFVVQSNKGVTKVINIPSELQRYVRRVPEAFLARKVLVCEGKTELGLCWGLDKHWSEVVGLEPFAFLGVVPTLGEGSDTANVAMCFASLGFDVAVLADSDRELAPSPDELAGQGVKVHLWGGGCAIEERIYLDLPWEGVAKSIELIAANIEMGHLRHELSKQMDADIALFDGEIAGWNTVLDEASIRTSLGKLSKDRSWFKRPDLGKSLGILVGAHLQDLQGTSMLKTINEVRGWIDAD